MPVQIGDIVVDQLEPPGTIFWRRGTWVSNTLLALGQMSWLAAVWIEIVMREWPVGEVASPGLLLLALVMLLLARRFETKVLRPLPVLDAHVRRRRALVRLEWALALAVMASLALMGILWRPLERLDIIQGAIFVGWCCCVWAAHRRIHLAEDRLLTEVERTAAPPAA